MGFADRLQSYYGYKNHINIDKAHKRIRRYGVTDASVHDSQVFDDLLDEENGDRSIWADSAYRSAAREEQLREQGYNSRIHRKGCKQRALAVIGLMNLTYNMRRLEFLLRPQSVWSAG